MIDNLKKGINNNVISIGKSISKESTFIFGLQLRADTLLSTIKKNHPKGNISDSQLLVYKSELYNLITAHNKISNVALSAKKRLKNIDKVISTLNITVNSLSIILNILQALPIPSQFSTIGVLMTISKKLNDASVLINQIKPYVNSVSITLTSLLEIFNLLLTLLETLNKTIQEIIELLLSKSTSFKTDLVLEVSDELDKAILPNTSNVIGSYKEYIFVLKPDDDPEFIVGTVRRNYAVAQLNGKDVYFSDKSYTLNPEILIEQLKLQIDNNQ